MREIILSHLCP